MTFLKQKKGIAALAAVAVVALGAMGAYAYFTSVGTGAGTATVGTSSTVNLSSPNVGPLYPGSGTLPVTVTINNPGTGSQFVGTVSGTVATKAGCDGSWFTVAPIAFNAEVAGGASPTAATTVRMNNVASSQDACKGLAMDIAWASN
jgi:predicted ribosomally synthesized peptide with SipW-like signal peptide